MKKDIEMGLLDETDSDCACYGRMIGATVVCIICTCIVWMIIIVIN